MKSARLIMIVDDDKNDRFFFKTSLEEIAPGIECIEARNGHMALAILQSHSPLPDFIFLDSKMPGMSGLECLQEIKKDERLKHIPVIMFSGAFTRQQKLDYSESGAALTLQKTFDFSQLPETIQKAVEIVKANAIYQ
jgi:CheY-like chemotaxis protein